MAVKVTLDDGAGDFLTVPLAVTEGGGTTVLTLVLGSTGSVTVTIAAGQDSQTITVGTLDDTADEADGTVTATITAEAGGPYRVNDTDANVLTAEATAAVTDNDLPAITSFAIGDNSIFVKDDTVSPRTVTVSVPRETSITGVTPVVATVRDDAMVTPSGEVDFVAGTAVDYTVEAGGDRVIYKVTILVLAGTPPEAPASFTATPGEERVTLSWMAPLEPGTGMIEKYQYRQVQGMVTGNWTDVAPLTATSQVVEGLTAGTAYGFQVRAVSDSGLAGDPSAVLEATPTAIPPPSFGASTIAAQSWTVGTTIPPLVLPEASGGTGNLTYILTPALPSDLSFDTDNRMVTGTPRTASTTATLHTYTVMDSAVSPLTASLTFTVTVAAAAVAGAPTFGTSTIAAQSWTVGAAITPLALPEASGGTGNLTYTLTPALPSDLSFDADNRMVTGTPRTASTTATMHTYTVTDSAVSSLTASLTFTVSVAAAAVAGAPTFGASTIAAQSWTVGAAITPLILPEASGGTGNLTYTLTPALPADLSFDADNRMVTGTPTTASTTATTHTYTVTDSAVSPLTASLTFMVAVAAGDDAPFAAAGGSESPRAWPNPAGDTLHVEWPSGGSGAVSVLTLTGQPVLSQSLPAGSGTLELSALPSGVYVLVLEAAGGTRTTLRLIRE